MSRMVFKMTLLKLIFFLIFLISINSAFTDNVILQIPNGLLLGREARTASNRLYYSFQKIPYATPPVGPLRFQPPQPAQSWDGILDATKLDISCYDQRGYTGKQSEDCLFINVYTTQLPNGNNDNNNSKPLPVMVFIYGGKFLGGSSIEALYGPQYLLDEDVIIVTMNYRTGVFGFLSTQDDVIPGNYGLKDQSLAIQWVYDNIEYFGGNREEITIFGQSAGSTSVSFQLLNRKLDGIIKGAIMESGVSICVWGNTRIARQVAFTIASSLNETFANSNDSVALREFLLNVPAEDLKQAGIQLDASELGDIWAILGPVIEVEHDNAFITTKMYENFRDGNFNKIPTIMGFTSEEYIIYAQQDTDRIRRAFRNMDANFDMIPPPDMRIAVLEDRSKMGEAIRSTYTNSTLTEDFTAGVKFLSDNVFIRPIIRAAQLMAPYTDVYFYRFSYDGELGGIDSDIEGVGHAEELNYLFYKTNPIDNTNIKMFPETDILTHKRLLKLWTNFGKTLNPTPESIDLLQNLTWSNVSSGQHDELIYLDIGEDLVLKTDPRNETYPQWKALYDSLGYDDFDTW